MISIKDGKTKNRKIENMLLNALHTKIRHTSWYALFYEPAAIYAPGPLPAKYFRRIRA